MNESELYGGNRMSNTSKGFEEKGSKYWMQVLVNLDNINGIPLDDYKKSEK